MPRCFYGCGAVVRMTLPYGKLCSRELGVGFGAIEAVIYSIGAIVPVGPVRGICVPHAGFGFLAGYFCGKSAKCGEPVYKWVGILRLGLRDKKKAGSPGFRASLRFLTNPMFRLGHRVIYWHNFCCICYSSDRKIREWVDSL